MVLGVSLPLSLVCVQKSQLVCGGCSCKLKSNAVGFWLVGKRIQFSKVAWSGMIRWMWCSLAASPCIRTRKKSADPADSFSADFQESVRQKSAGIAQVQRESLFSYHSTVWCPIYLWQHPTLQRTGLPCCEKGNHHGVWGRNQRGFQDEMGVVSNGLEVGLDVVRSSHVRCTNFCIELCMGNLCCSGSVLISHQPTCCFGRKNGFAFAAYRV